MFAPRSLFAFLALLVAAGSLARPAAAAQSYPLYCHSGGGIKVEVYTYSGGGEVDTTFKPGSAAASASTPSGECAWADRGWRPAEPTYICEKPVNSFHGIFSNGKATLTDSPNAPLTAGIIVAETPGGPKYIPGIFSESNKWYKFEVYNDGKCMRVTSSGVETTAPGGMKPPRRSPLPRESAGHTPTDTKP